MSGVWATMAGMGSGRIFLGLAVSLWILLPRAAGSELDAAGNGATLTLGTAVFRDGIERWSPGFERWPDVRLKVDRPAEWSWDLLEDEIRVRGIEIRLPASLFWFGYEWTNGEEEPRATFTLQHRF